MPSVFIYPYKKGSQSAASLAMKMGAKRIRKENSRFKGNQNKYVINWGASLNNIDLVMQDEINKCKVINKPEVVQRSSNKKTFMDSCDRHPIQLDAVQKKPVIPPQTTQFELAEAWIKEDGATVVCRTVLNGHSGEGIVLAHNVDELVPAPLYTMYVPKTSEWRLHFIRDRIKQETSLFDVQKKVKRKDYEGEHNRQIRNHQNGYIYQRLGLEIPDDVSEVATHVFNISGLEFGAVDVIFNRNTNRAYALEINTAPGLEGQTLESYTAALSSLIHE